MSEHWRLAFRCAAVMAALALPVGGVIVYANSVAHAGAFYYGVAIGLVCFVSMALTVSLLTRGSSVWRMVGAASFLARYGFAAGALGVPAYLGMWPVVAMLGGFSGVYLAENVVLVPAALKRVDPRLRDLGPIDDIAERRTE